MIKLKPAEASKIAGLLERVPADPKERPEILALIKRLRGQP